MSTSEINEIKRIPITDVAKRLGIAVDSHGKAMCFTGHDKASPSLSFKVDENYFKCFGCGIGGSCIDLVMKCQNTSSGDAIRWIKGQYGISIDGQGKDTRPVGKTPYKANGSVCEAVKQPNQRDGRDYSDLYAHLMSLLNTGEAVRYLEDRGIRRDIAERAGIAVIPKDMSSVKKTLNDKHGIERLKEAGIVATSDKGKDYFIFTYHRLIIPYHDADGNIICLQGRDIDGGSMGKYRLLKGITVPLYNLRAVHGLRPGADVHLCEGAIDVLSCYQLDLENPIGIAGVNNFRDEYFDILDPYRIIVAGDADHAGSELFQRLSKGFLKRGKTDILTIDYDKLKADYGVTEDVKDMNDIARLADYAHYNSIQPRRIYSDLLDESYTERIGGIQFDSGVFYTYTELERLKGIEDAELKGVHAIKKTFRGEIL